MKYGENHKVINMTVDEAIKAAKKEVTDPYAQNYLRAIPDSIEEYGKEGFKIQLSYALNNMRRWRGDAAKEAKKVLKKYATSL